VLMSADTLSKLRTSVRILSLVRSITFFSNQMTGVSIFQDRFFCQNTYQVECMHDIKRSHKSMSSTSRGTDREVPTVGWEASFLTVPIHMA